MQFAQISGTNSQMIREIYKFGWLPNGKEDQSYEYPGIWTHEMTGRVDRLAIAPRSGYVSLLDQLAFCLEEPLWLLYVLVVPRSSGEAGRYQSEQPLSFVQLKGFFSEYSTYLERFGQAGMSSRRWRSHRLWFNEYSVAVPPRPFFASLMSGVKGVLKKVLAILKDVTSAAKAALIWRRSRHG